MARKKAVIPPSPSWNLWKLQISIRLWYSCNTLSPKTMQVLPTIKRDGVKTKTPNYLKLGAQLPHPLSREALAQTRTTKAPTVSHQPHWGTTAVCDITSLLAYLSSGEWSNCCSEAFRIRRKRLNDSFKQKPRTSSTPLILPIHRLPRVSMELKSLFSPSWQWGYLDI